MARLKHWLNQRAYYYYDWPVKKVWRVQIAHISAIRWLSTSLGIRQIDRSLGTYRRHAIHLSIPSYFQEYWQTYSVYIFCTEKGNGHGDQESNPIMGCIPPMVLNAILQLMFDELDLENNGVNVDRKKKSLTLEIRKNIFRTFHSFSQSGL